MTGSPLLDLFLAMALFYFTLCMVCSSVNDAVARVLKWRAKTLEDGIRSLLLNATVPRKLPDGTPGKVELVDVVFQHPLIQTLRLQADLGDTWLSRRLDGFTGRLANAVRALAGSGSPDPNQPRLAPKTKLTFIPTAAFVHTLCEIVRQKEGGETEPLTFAALSRALDQLPDDTAGPLKVVLKSLVDDPSQNLDTIRAKLAKWFDDGMDQASVWYRHKMRTISIIIGTVMTLSLNIDSIEVANRFYRDGNLRAVYAAAGRQLINAEASASPSPPTQAPAQGPPVNPVGDLSLGWHTTKPQEIWAQLQGGMKCGGLVLTIIAIGMGASFWHDALTRLVGRKDGTPPPGTPAPASR
ncbi:MAG TPA: hypothetical protein VH092_22340 [Urbifossiella sp.]|jgi:hypothetical protein|nr:hypothetical protein [Urbifossiella sp.]